MRIKIVLAPVTVPSFLPLDQYALASLIYRTVALVAAEGAFCKHCVAAGHAMTHRSMETS